MMKATAQVDGHAGQSREATGQERAPGRESHGAKNTPVNEPAGQTSNQRDLQDRGQYRRIAE